MFSLLVTVQPYQSFYGSWFLIPLLMLPLLAVTVPSQQVRRLVVASGMAGLLAVALSIIIPNCCPTWCWLEPICWLW